MNKKVQSYPGFHQVSDWIMKADSSPETGPSATYQLCGVKSHPLLSKDTVCPKPLMPSLLPPQKRSGNCT